MKKLGFLTGLLMATATVFAQDADRHYKHQVPKGGRKIERQDAEFRVNGAEQSNNYKQQAPQTLEVGRIKNEPLSDTNKSWSTERRNYKRTVPFKHQ